MTNHICILWNPNICFNNNNDNNNNNNNNNNNDDDNNNDNNDNNNNNNKKAMIKNTRHVQYMRPTKEVVEAATKENIQAYQKKPGHLRNMIKGKRLPKLIDKLLISY